MQWTMRRGIYESTRQVDSFVSTSVDAVILQPRIELVVLAFAFEKLEAMERDVAVWRPRFHRSG